jgi:hypothetical protein
MTKTEKVFAQMQAKLYDDSARKALAEMQTKLRAERARHAKNNLAIFQAVIEAQKMLEFRPEPMPESMAFSAMA